MVNVGNRQNGRTRAENVVDVPFDNARIKNAIREQIKVGVYPRSDLYYKKDTSKHIADTLRSVDLYTQKRFYDT